MIFMKSKKLLKKLLFVFLMIGMCVHDVHPTNQAQTDLEYAAILLIGLGAVIYHKFEGSFTKLSDAVKQVFKEKVLADVKKQDPSVLQKIDVTITPFISLVHSQDLILSQKNEKFNDAVFSMMNDDGKEEEVKKTITDVIAKNINDIVPETSELLIEVKNELKDLVQEAEVVGSEKSEEKEKESEPDLTFEKHLVQNTIQKSLTSDEKELYKNLTGQDMLDMKKVNVAISKLNAEDKSEFQNAVDTILAAVKIHKGKEAKEEYAGEDDEDDSSDFSNIPLSKEKYQKNYESLLELLLEGKPQLQKLAWDFSKIVLHQKGDKSLDGMDVFVNDKDFMDFTTFDSDVVKELENLTAQEKIEFTELVKQFQKLNIFDQHKINFVVKDIGENERHMSQELCENILEDYLKGKPELQKQAWDFTKLLTHADGKHFLDTVNLSFDNEKEDEQKIEATHDNKLNNQDEVEKSKKAFTNAAKNVLRENKKKLSDKDTIKKLYVDKFAKILPDPVLGKGKNNSRKTNENNEKKMQDYEMKKGIVRAGFQAFKDGFSDNQNIPEDHKKIINELKMFE